MGRNKVPEDIQMTTRITIPFTQKDFETINARVEELKMKRTEYLRYLIQSDLLNGILPRIG